MSNACIPRSKLSVSSFGRSLSLPLHAVPGYYWSPKSVSCPRWVGSPSPQWVPGGLGTRHIPSPVISRGAGELLWEVLRSVTPRWGGMKWVSHSSCVLCYFVSIAINVCFALPGICKWSSQVGVKVIQLVVSPLQSGRNRSSFTDASVKLPGKTLASSSTYKISTGYFITWQFQLRW